MSVINHLYKGSIQKSLSDWTPFDNPEKILTWCWKWKFKFSSDNQSGMDKFNPPQELHFSGNIKFNPPQELNSSRNNSEHRKLWKQLILYLTATEKTRKSEEVKSSMLLTCIYSPYIIRLYLMMTPWKWKSIVFYNNLMIIAPLKKCDFPPIQIFLV